jgi:predicted esterase
MANAAVVQNVNAIHKFGQTFITWSESSDGLFYHIYRSTQPIENSSDLDEAEEVGIVDSTSTQNKRMKNVDLGETRFDLQSYYYYSIDDGETYLRGDQGLFVYTVPVDESAYYAVTSESSSGEDKSIVPGQNSFESLVVEECNLPRPVVQIKGLKGTNFTADIFAHWYAPESKGTDKYPAMASAAVVKTNSPSAAIFGVAINGSSSDKPPLLVRLHAAGGDFLGSLMPGTGNEIVLGLDNWVVPNWAPYSAESNVYWYGYYENYNPFVDSIPNSGTVQDYERRRVRWTIDWIINNYSVDTNRIYCVGGSQGGIGTLFMAGQYPDLFAATMAIAPMFDFGVHLGHDYNDYDPSSAVVSYSWNDDALKRDMSGSHFWGSLSSGGLLCNEGLSVYNSGLYFPYYLQRATREKKNLPYMFFVMGYNDDVVGWYEKPAIIDSVSKYHTGAQFFWAVGNHQVTLGSSHQWTPMKNIEQLYTFGKNKSYPVFSNCSINDDPGSGVLNNGAIVDGESIGTVGGHMWWDANNIIDSSDHYSILLNLRDIETNDELVSAPLVAVSDVTLRQLQKFKPEEGVLYHWERTADYSGVSLQSGISSLGSFGLLTIPAVAISREGSWLHITTQPTGLDIYASHPSPNFTISPSPFNSSFSVAVDAGTALGVEIYSMDGKLIYKWQSNSNKHIVQANKLPSAGIYLLKVSSGLHKFSTKICHY